jgi:hypothetical protein
MLKIKNGIVIQGSFDTIEDSLIKLVKDASFSTIVVHSDLNDFDDKCKAIIDLLASEGLQYAKKYVIARAAYES